MTAYLILAVLLTLGAGAWVWNERRDAAEHTAVDADMPDAPTWTPRSLIAETACEVTTEIPTVPREVVWPGPLVDDALVYGQHTNRTRPVRRRVKEYSGRHHMREAL